MLQKIWMGRPSTRIARGPTFKTPSSSSVTPAGSLAESRMGGGTARLVEHETRGIRICNSEFGGYMKILTIDEAASFLRITKRTLYQRLDIPRVRYGHRVMFIQEDLEKWVTGQSIAVDVVDGIRQIATIRILCSP